MRFFRCTANGDPDGLGPREVTAQIREDGMGQVTHDD
jgi:hypothetical protein